MNENPSMEKLRTKTFLIFIAILGCVPLFLLSCQSPEANKWTPPKFVKEWEIKEIKPGIPHQIISMAANKNGLFVLVRALETRYMSPKITKKVAEMNEKEKKNFIYQIVMGRLFSAVAVGNMTNKEKDELIGFLTSHFIPPRDAKEMSEEEKKEIIEFLLGYKADKEPEGNKNTFKEILQKEGKDTFINRMAENIRTSVKEEIEYCRIQHYDFEGNFSKQWPEENKLALPDRLRESVEPIIVHRFFPYREPADIDSRDYLIKPMKILSGDSGDIYLAEYKGNKIVEFDSSAGIKALWRMIPKRQTDEESMFKGVTLTLRNRILLLGEGEAPITPKLFEYDAHGRLIKSEELESKTKAYIKLFKNTLIPWLMKIERIVDMAVDNDGNIYLLMFKNITEKPTIVKLTPAWKEESEFGVVLKEGFETPRTKAYEKYFNGFDSTQWSWIETGPGFYFPSSIFVDGEYIYVTLLGLKPFGVIDAIIYDRKGKMAGYWKEESRSRMEWYKNLDPNIEVLDTNLSVTQYGPSVFVARTMEIRTGAFYMKNIIQKFNK